MDARSYRIWVAGLVAAVAVALPGTATAGGAAQSVPVAGVAAIPPTACPADPPLPPGSIATIAGTGAPGSSGDGGPATEASFELSFGHIAIDAHGAVYFADTAAKTIRRIGTDGIITTVVGPTTGATLVDPSGVALGPDGDLFIADFGASRIWRADPSGSVTVYAGTGVSGSTGDEGPATAATINAGGMAFGPDGSMYIDDRYRYRRIDPAGVIHAFAGTGTPGFSGDGGPALQAIFSSNGGMVSTDTVGNVYIADAGNFRVRKVDPQGVITTMAGSGTEGYGGDGGPAIEARLGTPHATAIDTDGSMFVTDDWDSNTIRRIGSDGVITTVAGGVPQGYAGDCGPATEATLRQPVQVAVRDGVVYIVDNGNNCIRVVVP